MKVPHDLLALELERTLHRRKLTTKQGAQLAGITLGEMKALLKSEVGKADSYLEALMALGSNLELACKARADGSPGRMRVGGVEDVRIFHDPERLDDLRGRLITLIVDQAQRATTFEQLMPVLEAFGLSFELTVTRNELGGRGRVAVVANGEEVAPWPFPEGLSPAIEAPTVAADTLQQGG